MKLRGDSGDEEIQHRKAASRDKPRRLTRSFFAQKPDVVAAALVGATMTVARGDIVHEVIIAETEAYGGRNDPASHAFRGPTARSAAMFGPAGHVYVYKIYGLHWCANVVTGQSGDAGAVLLRAGIHVPRRASNIAEATSMSLTGPGNLARHLQLTGEDTGADCCGSGDICFFSPSAAYAAQERGASTRIGITKATNVPWRFFLLNSPAVSRRRTERSTGSDSRSPERTPNPT